MESLDKQKITVKAKINAPITTVWRYWTSPEDIIRWNSASDDWHTTRAENDLRVGGKFSSRMEAKDGSFGFDFCGVYDTIILHELIEYTLEDDRKVSITFSDMDNYTVIAETFEAEGENTVELQRTGWQAILDNFKKYAELHNKLQIHSNEDTNTLK